MDWQNSGERKKIVNYKRTIEEIPLNTSPEIARKKIMRNKEINLSTDILNLHTLNGDKILNIQNQIRLWEKRLSDTYELIMKKRFSLEQNKQILEKELIISGLYTKGRFKSNKQWCDLQNCIGELAEQYIICEKECNNKIFHLKKEIMLLNNSSNI